MAGGFNWQVALAILVVLGIGYTFLGGNFTGAASTITPYSLHCSDTDGGLIVTTQGTCTDDHRTYTDICQSAGKSVVEYYCSAGNRCAGQPQQCAAGRACISGKCV